MIKVGPRVIYRYHSSIGCREIPINYNRKPDDMCKLVYRKSRNKQGTICTEP